MSCYTFGHMRGALPTVSSRPQQGVAQPRLSLPSFSGLHSCASLPSCLSTGGTIFPRSNVAEHLLGTPLSLLANSDF